MEEIIQELRQKRDQKYQEFQSKLCPNTNNIIGVRIPILRDIAKRIAKENPEIFLKQINTDYYETVMLYGMVIGYIKTQLSTREKYLDVFVPAIHNWAICDCSVSTYQFTKQNPKEVLSYLQKYIYSNKEFEIRFAIIMLMDYYLTDEYIDTVFQILKNIKHDGYYVKMGVAWTIATAFVKYEEKTVHFLKQNHLDEVTHNKAIQKIIESNRVPKLKKEEMRKLKK